MFHSIRSPCHDHCTHAIFGRCVIYVPFADFIYREIQTRLCNVLYTFLRPVVIREWDIDTLCQLVHILKFEVLEEQIAPRGMQSLLPPSI